MQKTPSDWKTRCLDAVDENIHQASLKRLPRRVVEEVYLPLAETIALRAKGSADPFVVALSGSPGTGKSTLAAYLAVLLDAGFSLRGAGLSMDDLYFSHQERQELGRRIHPLLAIRGVPGTHRLELGFDTVRRLQNAQESTMTRLPRFSKHTDDPLPEEKWPTFIGRPDVIFIDSWFWHLDPEPESFLERPLNERERVEDPNGTWRRTVNDALRSGYPEFFEQAEFWVQLLSPSWAATVRWRVDQEMDLRASLPKEERETDDPTLRLAHFLQVFQRSATRAPGRTPDVRLDLDEAHDVIRVVGL